MNERYPRTPIRIRFRTPGQPEVWAWFWNGRERQGSTNLPIFRLRRGTEIPKKSWRNGRVLTTPFRSSYVQTWQEG